MRATPHRIGAGTGCRRAPLADAIIAQSCLDHNAPLITRDADFSAFARWAGLRLLGS